MSADTERLRALLACALQAEDRQVLTEVCHAAGIGVADVLSKSRSQRVARARAAVAWSLHRKFKWRQKRVAEALGVTVRAVKKMAVSSPC